MKIYTEDIGILELMKSDLYRYSGKSDPLTFLHNILLNSGFKYTFWLRMAKKYKIFRLLWLYYSSKYLIDISPTTNIGKGLYLGHAMGIVIAEQATLGNNCNISQFVTIGVKNRGAYKGYPIIGNDVYIGPGAKIIGSVRVGDDVAIGANCVVTKDVPSHAVVVGVPARIVSYNGSESYVDNKA
jgi:serine O-acetyltransferase